MSNYDDSFKRIHQIISESLLPTVQIQKILTSSPAFSTAENISKILEPYRNLGKAFKAAYSNPISDALNSCMSEPLAKALSASVNRSISNSLKNNPNFKEFSSILDNVTPELIFSSLSNAYDFSETSDKASQNNDCIVLDAAVCETYNLPTSIATPINTQKRQISETNYFAIITLIVAIISGIIVPAVNSYLQSKPSESELIRNELLHTQNEILEQFVSNTEISDAKKLKTINELKQSVEELAQCQENSDKSEEHLDNRKTVEDTYSSR